MDKPIAHYFPTRKDVEIQSKVFKMGFRPYPVPTKSGKFARYTLEVEYRGQIKKSEVGEFSPRFLTWHVHRTCKAIYEYMKKKGELKD
jgi:hypothetical protein